MKTPPSLRGLESVNPCFLTEIVDSFWSTKLSGKFQISLLNMKEFLTGFVEVDTAFS